nr:hypothetical protein [Solidesulfovibrio fructosivorans]
MAYLETMLGVFQPKMVCMSLTGTPRLAAEVAALCRKLWKVALFPWGAPLVESKAFQGVFEGGGGRIVGRAVALGEDILAGPGGASTLEHRNQVRGQEDFPRLPVFRFREEGGLAPTHHIRVNNDKADLLPS